MNILVVVVMAAIWVVGSIIKAAKEKSGDQQPPSRKPPPHGRGVQRQTPARTQRPAGPAKHSGQPAGPLQKRTTLADLRAAARKFAAQAEQAFQPQPPDPATEPSMPAAQAAAHPETAPALETSVEPVIESIVAPIKGLDDKQAAAKLPQTKQLSDLLADYADPERLRKAILHYEILGPPVSLRD